MRKNLKYFIPFFSFLLIQGAIADSANPSFTIGNRNIVIPAPYGFYEVTQISEYDRKLMESFTPDSQRLVGAFYTESDIGRVLKNEDPQLETYILIKVLKSRENTSISKKEFNEFKTYARNNLGKVSDLVSDNVSGLFEKASKDLSVLTGITQEIQINQIVQLGIFNESDNSLSNAMFTRYAYSDNISDGSYVAAITNTYLLVENKMLTIDMYQLYEQPKDLIELRDTTRNWIKSF